MKSGAAQRLDHFSPDDPQGATPECFLTEIRIALEANRVAEALELVKRAVAFFPDHADVKRMYRVLTPGRSRSVPGNRIPDRHDSYQWIRENAERYKRQWIAVLGPSLIAASPELEEVLEAIQKAKLAETPVLMFVA
jgi:hypothetical protein